MKRSRPAGPLDPERLDVLRAKAAQLLDGYPESLCDKREHLAIARILQTFLWQNPPRRHDADAIGKLVEKSIAYRVAQGIARDKAVPAARKAYAEVFGKSFDTIKKAHERHLDRGGTKARKVSRPTGTK